MRQLASPKRLMIEKNGTTHVDNQLLNYQATYLCPAAGRTIFDIEEQSLRTQMTDDNKIAEEILDYLQEHPEAADTLEGITTWWVQSQTVRESVDTVYRALKELKASGLVIERRDSDGKTLYFLSRS